MRRGVWGPMRSCHPPITVPAWMIMASGQDAGAQGVYGFRSRTGPGYGDLTLTRRDFFQGQPIWERLGDEGLRSTIIGVPGTWPPRPLAGQMITGPLTPQQAPHCWPRTLETQVEALAGARYAFDVEGFRELPPDVLIERVCEMTQARFEVALELARQDDWNLLWVVEIGLDRLYHALWHCIDPTHPRYVDDPALAGALLDYHKQLDGHIGALVEACDDGETAFVVVSDHGAKSMTGGFLLNQWLIEQGLMTLKAPLESKVRFDPALIDWSQTRVWAMGGYCGRLFVNLEGREPQGIVKADEVEAILAQIEAGLQGLVTPQGEALAVETHRTGDLYREALGWPPEMVVYLGDLAWRALDTVGAPSVWAKSNDSGPDSANHAWHGIFIAAGGGLAHGEAVEGFELLDVAPLLETLLDVEVTR